MKGLFTEKQARSKWCPWMPGTTEFCMVNDCMAWVEVHKKLERENHSGAEKMLREVGTLTGQQVRKWGPDNSSGFVVLDALGYCGRNHLMKNEVKK